MSYFTTHKGKANPETLIGTKAIASYCGISTSTLDKWKRFHAFPACPLPDGRLFTSKSLIDKWILARQDAYISTKGGGRPILKDPEQAE